MDTRRIDEYLKRLKNVEKFMQEKLEQKEEEKKHYLRAELQALSWMIRYVEDTSLIASEHQYKWFKEREGKNE